MKPATETPWQRVFAKFNMTRSEFARALGRHRSKVSRELLDKKGLINGRDQERILEVAKEYSVRITPRDMVAVR